MMTVLVPAVLQRLLLLRVDCLMDGRFFTNATTTFVGLHSKNLISLDLNLSNTIDNNGPQHTHKRGLMYILTYNPFLQVVHITSDDHNTRKILQKLAETCLHLISIQLTIRGYRHVNLSDVSILLQKCKDLQLINLQSFHGLFECKTLLKFVSENIHFSKSIYMEYIHGVDLTKHNEFFDQHGNFTTIDLSFMESLTPEFIRKCAVRNPKLVTMRLMCCGTASSVEAKSAIDFLLTMCQSIVKLDDGISTRDIIDSNHWGCPEILLDDGSLWGDSDFSSSGDYWESSSASTMVTDNSELDTETDP
jgi:hypothetical protein